MSAWESKTFLEGQAPSRPRRWLDEPSVGPVLVLVPTGNDHLCSAFNDNMLSWGDKTAQVKASCCFVFVALAKLLLFALQRILTIPDWSLLESESARSQTKISDKISDTKQSFTNYKINSVAPSTMALISSNISTWNTQWNNIDHYWSLIYPLIHIILKPDQIF